MAQRLPYTLTVRRTGSVQHEHHATLDAALVALERVVAELARSERRGIQRAFVRELEPVMQVAARAEIAGPGRLRAGVDTRGDGSTEAFTGRWRRRLVEQHPGEDAVAALRRAIRP